MRIIDRLEKAQAQLWWLPQSAEVYESNEYCYYLNSGSIHVVRFSPQTERIRPCLEELVKRFGDIPVEFSVFPHHHGERVSQTLKSLGFMRDHTYEAQAIHVNEYKQSINAELDVKVVQSLEEMRLVYALRAEVFGTDHVESEENLKRYVKDSFGSKARAKQFLVIERSTGKAIAQAGMALYPDLKVAFLFAGGTLAAARGRGAYTALIAARSEYAQSVGIDYIGIFAQTDTSSPILTRQGFKCHGEMHRWLLNRTSSH